MASTGFPYTPTLTKIDTLLVDASIKEDHDAEVEVTDHAVEQGAAITDHARPKPVELTIEGLVSNTPISISQQSQSASSVGSSSAPSSYGIYTMMPAGTTSGTAGARGFAEAAYTMLRDLRDNPRLITIVTGLRKYTNMLLTSLKVPREAKTGEALNFTAKFKEVRLATTTTTVVSTKQPKAKAPKKTTTSTVPTPTPMSDDLTDTLTDAGILQRR